MEAAAEPIALALEHPDRLAEDRERDARRKPAAVLEFFAIGAGMTVLDLYSGGGYYAELLSYLVGERGRVYAHNNAAYLDFAREELEKRYRPGRLANLERIQAENNELELPENAFDAVLMILTYHDLYYVDAQNGWPKIDGPKLLGELHSAMQPGAVLGIVDHVAAAGSPPETGGTLHRIDPEIVVREVTAAGFIYDGESEALRNSEDDPAQSAFADGIRGRTSQFILRFRKP